MKRLLFCIFAFCVLFDEARAGGCYQQSVSYGYAVKAYVAPVVQQYYFVGAEIRAAAVIEAEKRTDPDYQNFLEFKAWKAHQAEQQQQSAVPPGALPQRQSLIEQRCVRCHSGPEPKGGRDFSGSLSVDDLRAIKEILPSGKMPPPTSPEAKEFSNELAGQLILESIDRLGDTEPHPPGAQAAPSPPWTDTQPPEQPLPPIDDIPPPPPQPPVEQ